MAFTGRLGTDDSQLGNLELGSDGSSGSSTVSGSFTADGVFLVTQSGSFTANAALKATIASSFTADATVFNPGTSTFSADAILLRTQTTSLSADAVLLASHSSSFTADAIGLRTQVGSFGADAVLITIVAASFSADAYVDTGVIIRDFIADAQDAFPTQGNVILAHNLAASAFTVEADDPDEFADWTDTGNKGYTGWVKLIVPSSALGVTLDTLGSDMVDTQLFLYDEVPTAASVAIEINDDIGSGPESLHSRIVVDLSPGTYYLAIQPYEAENWDFGSDGSMVQIHVEWPSAVFSFTADAILKATIVPDQVVATSHQTWVFGSPFIQARWEIRADSGAQIGDLAIVIVSWDAQGGSRTWDGVSGNLPGWTVYLADQSNGDASYAILYKTLDVYNTPGIADYITFSGSTDAVVYATTFARSILVDKLGYYVAGYATVRGPFDTSSLHAGTLLVNFWASAVLSGSQSDYNPDYPITFALPTFRQNWAGLTYHERPGIPMPPFVESFGANDIRLGAAYVISAPAPITADAYIYAPWFYADAVILGPLRQIFEDTFDRVVPAGDQLGGNWRLIDVFGGTSSPHALTVDGYTALASSAGVGWEFAGYPIPDSGTLYLDVMWTDAEAPGALYLEFVSSTLKRVSLFLDDPTDLQIEHDSMLLGLAVNQWYTVHYEWTTTSNRATIWPRGDTEPDWMVSGASTSVSFAYLPIFQPFANIRWDNLRMYTRQAGWYVWAPLFADAIKLRTQTTHFNEFLVGVPNEITLDAYFERGIKADAVITNAVPVSFSADAVLVSYHLFHGDAVIVRPTRTQHDRGVEHTGIDHETDHILAFMIDDMPQGTNLRDVLIEIDTRLSDLEAQ